MREIQVNYGLSWQQIYSFHKIYEMLESEEHNNVSIKQFYTKLKESGSEISFVIFYYLIFFATMLLAGNFC
jgi:hypothetical protein